MKLDSRTMPIHQSMEGEAQSKGCRNQLFARQLVADPSYKR